ncbi:conjugal transfer protein TraG N-terminal domain-containing protein [Ottowia sp.]|uniref:conjugal transfer protein TraG N-terminal domain-containing protein n=1 Tax=Ottowia sp. TaxID=1898956 RepID=UPI002628DC60|nr:conjugal transfer protein TraG N-terminal domain-containing protein [Ottowia sp.]
MWEIYAYQNSASLFGVFNAAAAIHASGDYLSAVAAVAFCGFVAALIAYAFAPEKLQGWKWLATVVLVFSLLIVPKVTVGIVDKTGSAPVQVVDNVPFGAALLGSLTSTIGHTLTGLFETAFQVIPGAGALPSELSYERNGLMFGNRLIRETSGVVFQDPNFRTDLINFIHNCTTYDLLDGTISPSAFSTSDDVWPLMATPNPARFTPITSAAGGTIETCPTAYLNLNGRLPAQITRLQGQLAFQLNPTLPGAAAASVISGQIQQAYLKNSIASASATAADLIRQNAMLNAISDTGKIVGQKVNDPAAMVLAVGRAQGVAQQNAAWLNAGKVAEQALPVFRNVVEAVSYALFPLFVLLLLLTSGREAMMAFKGYAAILIWIQLWPPLYAVLNYMASIYASYDIAAAADLGTGLKGLNLQTASSIYSRTISGEAIVGYLSISIPFLAWTAVKRMENFGSAMVGGLSGLQTMLGASTGSAALGNTSLGNVSMDQMRLAPNRTSAFMGSWQNDLTGDTFSSSALTGRSAVSLLRNQGFASRVVSMQVSEQDVQQAGRQVDAARGEAVAATTERSAALSEVFSRGLSKLRSTRNSGGTSSSSFEQMGETLNKLDQVVQTVSQSTGLSQAQVARLAFGAAAHVGADAKFIGGRFQASGDKSYLSGLSAQEQKALASLTGDQLVAFKQFGDRVSKDTSFVQSVSSDASEAREMSTRLNTTQGRSERADATLSDRINFANQVSTAYAKGEAISIDIAQDPHNMEMFLRYAQTYGGNSAAAQAMMSAELARQSLGPNRVLSDGSSLPTSFEGVRGLHQRQRSDPALSPNVQNAHRANAGATSRFGSDPSQPLARPTDPPSPIRSEVQQRSEQIRDKTTSAAGAFDSKAEIVKTDDGTLASKKSLLGQSMKQVGKDATTTAQEVTDAAKDLFKRK